MSLHSLIVHVDDGSGLRARVDAALQLAGERPARLVGTYLVPTPPITPTSAATLPAHELELRLRHAQEAQADAERRFRAATAGTRHAIEWRAPAGDPFDAAVAHARCADLAVMGQGDPREEDGGFVDRLVAAALLGAGRPILVVPYIGLQAPIGQRILVATDGGREASRAIGDAMPLLERAAQVHVVLGAPTASTGVEGYALARARLATWLGDHGVHAHIESFEAPASDAGALLLSRAADFGSDLLVMGGYGHARVRELVLGGATRSVLRSMSVPVLMSH